MPSNFPATVAKPLVKETCVVRASSGPFSGLGNFANQIHTQFGIWPSFDTYFFEICPPPNITQGENVFIYIL